MQIGGFSCVTVAILIVMYVVIVMLVVMYYHNIICHLSDGNK